MTSTARLLHWIRLIHRYFGLLIAPSVLFLTFSGALQLFSLHETTQGSSYKPPAWAATMAQLHKKQTAIVPPKKQPPAAPAKPGQQADPASPTAPETRLPNLNPRMLPLKFFFLVVSLGLMLSTLTGIYMGYKYTRNNLLVTGVLLLGTVLPIVLAWYASV